MLVWMDLEMTGLDPARDVIVEIATLVTDDDLVLVDEGLDLVVHQPDEALTSMQDVVREMHTASGLIHEIKRSTVSLEEAGRRTLEYIKGHVPEARSVPLCGNSIGTDRRFLVQYLPEIEEYLRVGRQQLVHDADVGAAWPEVVRQGGRVRAVVSIASLMVNLRLRLGLAEKER